MDKNKTLYYLENSFLAELLNRDDVTDISYNGKDFYYVTNLGGRKKSDIQVERQEVKDFLRQMANLTEKQFSFTSPNLDVTVGKYRINATHQSIGRILDDGVVTFSLRIASERPKISDDSSFLTPKIVELIRHILKNRESIVIGGITGVGKTEFQKYLIRKLNRNERVIVIDNVTELEQVRSEDIDLTCWLIDDNNPNSDSASLIKNALRNNPDWLILAEARSKEMLYVLESAMTGLPIVTTVHAFDANSIPFRMARMIMSGNQKLDYKETLKDIYYHFHYYFYLSKEETPNGIKRYISQINYVDSKGSVTVVFKNEGEKYIYNKIDELIANKGGQL